MARAHREPILQGVVYSRPGWRGSVEVRVTIPLPAADFDDLLVDAFDAARRPAAMVVAVSALAGADGTVRELEIELEVRRRKEAITTIRRLLREANAPPATVIKMWMGDEWRTSRLARAAPRATFVRDGAQVDAALRLARLAARARGRVQP